MNTSQIYAFVKPYLEYEIWNNPAQKVITSILLLFVILIALKIFRKIILGKLAMWAKKTKTDIDDELVNIIENISPFFYWVVSFFFVIQRLNTSEFFMMTIEGIFVIVFVYEMIKLVQNILGFVIQKSTKQKESTAMSGINLIIKIILWSIGLLLVLSNLGVDVSALVASLGIGGIAVALAAQNILEDLFSSFSIYFDKPFSIGDFITVGSDSGTVKKIGLKTTRIQTMQGEELVISNKELTTTRVQNFKKLKRRRNTFQFGLIYETDPKVLKRIPEMVKSLIDQEKLAESDRVVFTDFGDFSLNFTAVYYIDSPTYEDYAQTQHRINIALLDKFNAEKIEMAFPTQTVYVAK